MNVDLTIAETLNRHFREHPELGVVSAYLFGSHAAGRAHRESDVDLGILLDRSRYPRSADRFEARVQMISDLGTVLHRNDLDLVILNDAPPLFGRKILYEGRRIFLGDPAADRAFGRDVQLRAADLEPWLRRMRRLQLEALAR